jgi:hypothetical protein
MDWKCVLCFAIVGNKIRYRQLQLNDSKYNEIVFEFNGHLTGKYICVKCHKCVIELVKLRSDINDIKINLQQCEGKADDIREKLNSIRDRNRISPLPVATPVAITPNIGTDSTFSVFIDTKLLLLHFFPSTHSKYRLWLWRMLANYHVTLSSRKAFEYKWNVSVNILGGVGNNIPDDNLVELHVRWLKELLKAQGANVTYDSAKLAFASIKYVKELKDCLLDATESRRRYTRRSAVSKDNDCAKLASVLVQRLPSPPPLAHYFQCVDLEAFNNWCNEQAKTLDAVLM